MLTEEEKKKQQYPPPPELNYQQETINSIFEPTVYPQPTAGKDFAARTAESAKWNVLSQALTGVAESAGLAMGAPIEKRKDKFALTALQNYQRQINQNANQEYRYDLLDLRQKTLQDQMQQRAAIENSRMNARIALDKFGKETGNWRLGIQQEGATKRNKEAIEGANKRERYRQNEITKRSGYTGTGTAKNNKLTEADREKAFQLWKDSDYIQSQFKERDNYGNEYPVNFGDMNDNQIKNILGIGNYQPQSWYGQARGKYEQSRVSGQQEGNHGDYYYETVGGKEMKFIWVDGQLFGYDKDKNEYMVDEDGLIYPAK